MRYTDVVTSRRTLLTLLATLPATLLHAELPPLPTYRHRAEEISDYIQRNLWVPDVHRYRAAFPPDPKALPFDFMWADGVQFSALVGGLRYEPAKYRPRVDSFFDGLQGYFDTNVIIPAYDAYLSSPGNSDKYYDDNAWMALTFVEAFELTSDHRFLDRAATLMRFIYSGWDEKCGGGIYWREEHKSKNTCSNGPSATAALAVARHTASTYHIDWAKRIVTWTNKTLQAPDGTFWDNINAADGHIEKTKWTYNTALMLRANLGLFRATKDNTYLTEAKRLAKVSVIEFTNTETGAFRDEANFSHLLIEALLDLYGETHEPYLLETAKRNADFVYRVVRDPQDGAYFTQWKNPPRHDDRKTLMTNASIARLFWLMVPFE